MPNGWPVTWLPVVWLVPHHFSSSTLSISPEPVLPTMPNQQRRASSVRDNSTVWSMSTERLLLLTVLPVYTVVSVHQSSVSLSTEVSTSECTTPSSQFSSSVLLKVHSWPHSLLVGLSPPVPVLLHTHWTPFDEEWWWHLVKPSSTRVHWMLLDKSWLPKGSDHSSRVPVPTFSVVLQVPVSCPSMIVSWSIPIAFNH